MAASVLRQHLAGTSHPARCGQGDKAENKQFWLLRSGEAQGAAVPAAQNSPEGRGATF